MVIDTEGKATRVGYRRDEESGKNVRIVAPFRKGPLT